MPDERRLAVLDAIARDKLLEQVRTLSGPWIAALTKLAAEFPTQLTGVRGRGYLVGLQLASDPAPYVAAARERGLLVVSAGGNVIRVLPPLIATAAELARSVEILRAVLAAKG